MAGYILGDSRGFRLRVIAALIVFGTFSSFSPIMGQQIVSAATLRGVVRDVAGNIVVGADVTLRSRETNLSSNSTTDENGEFRFGYVPVGNYEILVDQPGYDSARRSFTATLGDELFIGIDMKIAGVSASVDVDAEVPVTDNSKSQISENVSPADIEKFPLNGRNFLDLALLLPAVSRTNTGSVQKFAETSAVPGTGISIAGQRNLNNSFIVDGSSANDDAAELVGTYYSQEVIREFQVVTSGAMAELGRASAGIVNIVTQSGTDRWRGKVYGFLRDARFDARNPLASSTDPLTQTQYGGSLAGPIFDRRTFLFTNFEQTRRNDSNVITIAPVNAAAINNRLNQFGYPGRPVETGVVPGGYDATNIFARLDRQINERNFLGVTYNFYEISALNARTVGGLNAVGRGTDLRNRDHTLNLQNVTVFGPDSTNELRVQYRHSSLAAPVIDEVGPAVNISGVANFGTATSSPTARDLDLVQVSNAVSFTTGRHTVKFGGEFLYNRAEIVFPGALQGVYSFNSLANFLNANGPVYSQFQQAFGTPGQKQSNPNFAIYGQDQWQLKKLTLNFGVRYDAQLLPEPVNTDWNNLAPRFGFTYAPFRKTILRGSVGLYFDRLPLRAVSNALQRDGSKYIVVQLSPTSPGAPVFPSVLQGVPSTLLVKPNITRIDPDIENSYSEQANIQLERQLSSDSSVSVGYIHLRGLHLILSRNANVPRCGPQVDANLCRPDADLGNISRYESSGDSYFDGMVVSFNKRSKRASVRLSYTLSKAIDDAGNFFFSTPQNNFDLRDDRGLSDNDQRHRFTLSGTLSLPRNWAGEFGRRSLGGFQLSYIFNYASRLPFNIVTGSDRNGDSNNNDRPAGVGRNTGRGFDFASLDLRLSRRFNFSERLNLELIAEGFNVLNRANYSVPNNTFGTGSAPISSFGRPTAAFDARQLQLGFRFNF